MAMAPDKSGTMPLDVISVIKHYLYFMGSGASVRHTLTHSYDRRVVGSRGKRWRFCLSTTAAVSV